MTDQNASKIVIVIGGIAAVLIVVFREWLRCHPIVSGIILFTCMFGMLACIGYYIWETNQRK